MKGKIKKAISGFYYVISGKEEYTAKARGVFKNTGITPLVGDDVDFEVTHREDKEAVINNIYPRKNSFIRPPIANVDLMAIVVAVREPNINYNVLDKFLVTAESKDIDVIICINKIDLAEEGETEKFLNVYKNIYPVYSICGNSAEGTEELKGAIKGRTVAFAGASGVGKSTVINLLKPGANAETGRISNKTGRGRHTTRHVEIFEAGGGYIYDTPGFTSLDIDGNVDEMNLCYMFPEMTEYIKDCRFDNCKHINEPGCSVTEAVKNGEISESRYESYRLQMKMIREKRTY